jgi:hypothetical protein
MESITFNTAENKITVTMTDGAIKEYFDSESYLADWPDRSEDCYVFSYQAEPTPVAVPQVVTIRQAKLALLQAGLLDDVDAAVAQAPREVQIEWEYATEVHRSWPTLLTLQALLSLSDEQVDNLFILASTL